MRPGDGVIVSVQKKEKVQSIKQALPLPGSTLVKKKYNRKQTYLMWK